MTIEIESLAVIPDYVHPSDLFDVTIDISTWLGADTIASAVLSAVDEDGDDATTTVLGTGSNTNTVITVNLKGGGTHDVKYMIKIVVTTAAAEQKTFYLQFHCFDYSEEI